VTIGDQRIDCRNCILDAVAKDFVAAMEPLAAKGAGARRALNPCDGAFDPFDGWMGQSFRHWTGIGTSGPDGKPQERLTKPGLRPKGDAPFDSREGMRTP